ncbi:hypothetical protein [Alteriqipengyuania sp. 357]
MKINRTTAVLIALILLLAGAVAFLLAQRGSDDDEPASAAVTGGIISSRDMDEADYPEEPASVAAQGPLAVRIGRDGPLQSACDRVGRVGNLPRGAEDILAVIEAPTTDAIAIDGLYEDDPFYVCDRQGDWYGIIYPGDGTLGDGEECDLSYPVESPRAYPGSCLTGWVDSRYVDAGGAQDSDEAYAGEETADAAEPAERAVQVSATGPTRVAAATRLSAKAHSEYDQPVGQRPDGNRVSCRETGSGDATWTCTATYTLSN